MYDFGFMILYIAGRDVLDLTLKRLRKASKNMKGVRLRECA